MRYLLLCVLVVVRLGAADVPIRDQLQQLVGDGYRVMAEQGRYNVESVQLYKGCFIGINAFTRDPVNDPNFMDWEDQRISLQIEDVVLHESEAIGDLERVNRHVEEQLQLMSPRLKLIPHRIGLVPEVFYSYSPRNDDEQAQVDIARSLFRSMRPIPDMRLDGRFLHIMRVDYTFRDQAVRDQQNALLAKLRNWQQP